MPNANTDSFVNKTVWIDDKLNMQVVDSGGSYTTGRPMLSIDDRRRARRRIGSL